MDISDCMEPDLPPVIVLLSVLQALYSASQGVNCIREDVAAYITTGEMVVYLQTRITFT